MTWIFRLLILVAVCQCLLAKKHKSKKGDSNPENSENAVSPSKETGSEKKHHHKEKSEDSGTEKKHHHKEKSADSDSEKKHHHNEKSEDSGSEKKHHHKEKSEDAGSEKKHHHKEKSEDLGSEKKNHSKEKSENAGNEKKHHHKEKLEDSGSEKKHHHNKDKHRFTIEKSRGNSSTDEVKNNEVEKNNDEKNAEEIKQNVTEKLQLPIVEVKKDEIKELLQLPHLTNLAERAEEDEEDEDKDEDKDEDEDDDKDDEEEVPEKEALRNLMKKLFTKTEELKEKQLAHDEDKSEVELDPLLLQAQNDQIFLDKPEPSALRIQDALENKNKKKPLKFDIDVPKILKAIKKLTGVKLSDANNNGLRMGDEGIFNHKIRVEMEQPSNPIMMSLLRNLLPPDTLDSTRRAYFGNRYVEEFPGLEKTLPMPYPEEEEEAQLYVLLKLQKKRDERDRRLAEEKAQLEEE